MVEIIPKPPAKTPLWQNILLYFALALILVVVLSYFSLDFFQRKSLKRFDESRKILIQEKSREQKQMEDVINEYQKKFQDYPFLLSSRQSKANLLSFFENICHPMVRYTIFTFDAGKSKATIVGQTEGFQALGEQLLVFQAEPLFKDVKLTKISRKEEGAIEFACEILLSPEIFTSIQNTTAS